MIKRIIFDQDNTLMMWKLEYNKHYGKAFEELNIKYDEEDLDNIDKAIDKYESLYDRYDRKNMNNLIRKYSKVDIPDNFIDVLIKNLCNCYSEEDKNIEKTLSYLSKKYELVVLSNWFSYNQIERLKHIGVDKYFCDMIFTEDVKNKPNKEAFIKACGEHDPSECIMIGDNYSIDILGALNAGLDAILIDKNDKFDYEKKIKSLDELEELL